MTKRAFFLAAALLTTTPIVSGCSEYDISTSSDVTGTPNPKQLENPVQVDRIVQVTTPQVDVLWVIDNSCSMLDEQNALTSTFPSFMDYFVGSGLDYHVGVVSTDMDAVDHSGKLQSAAGVNFIVPETPDPVNVFSSMASMGTSGSGDEKGIAAAYTAIELKKDGANKDFIREDASLHVVLISDENDFSNGVPITKMEFINYLVGLKAGSNETTFSSIVNCQMAMPGCVLGTPLAESAGTDYIDVTNAVGGILSEIHKGDWDVVLEKLGVQATGLKREYFLSQLPVAETIIVYVVEEDVRFDFIEGDDWVYDSSRNSITFLEYVPTALSQVFVEYDILASQEQ